ncbi:CIS tube protein [Fodinicola feengrottensis]|nr:peptidase M23 [Fodinicola feengrottensis]
MSSPVTFSSPGTPAASTYGSTPPDKLMHASLIVMEPPASATTGEPGAQIDEIKFQFNPKELSLTKTAKWKRSDQRNAKKSAPPEFTGSDPAKLQLEMFLDGTEKMDDSVVKTVEKLFQCCVPTAKSNSNTKSSPPWVKFVWGGMHSFPGAITTVTAKYTLFSSSGTPIRALCTLTLEEISGTTPARTPPPGRWPAGTYTPPRLATRSPRSPTRRTGTPSSGVTWPRPTTSTTRWRCGRAPGCSSPRLRT